MAKEIRQASDTLGIQFLEMPPAESAEFHNRIVEKFKMYKSQTPYWEQFSPEIAIHDPQGWKKISKFIHEAPVYLYFDEHNETSVFKFDSPNDLESVLAETTGFVFYISPIDLEIIVSFNDHDMLMLVRLGVSSVSG
ncbi:hypothetical protein [Deinococcus frigens]|uniref:hypothetical protein n=1 Tax=Deinococcus frigens TaxID=249403 RepID=UPI0012EB8396|nr:hypothetical protein [Deinococcus frigens]